MKPQQLILIILLFAASAASAQKPDSALAMVHYKYTWLRDTNNRDKPYTENMALYVGRSASVYKSYDRKMQLADMKKQLMAQVSNNVGGNIKIQSKGTSSAIEYYLFPNENKLVRKENIYTNYLIDEPFPVIKWKISSDTMTIRNLACQKATAHFKGRDYTAWFCPDLPYRAGPWKLSGLPGLIVEAHDTKNEVIFKFDGIDPITKADKAVKDDEPQIAGIKMITVNGGNDVDDPSVIALPDNGVKTTEKELANLKEARRKDPTAFMQAQMAGSGMPVMRGAPIRSDSFKVQLAPPPVINNPVELSDK